ncbi:MAG: LytTR family DNA-binding domain-containing protein [Bacteroidia bacterium]|nr:LytTR family DNA-binding domain-containing protein [Bacteroidia bacterium]
MKILVIEDEPLIARLLMQELRGLRPLAELVGPLASVREARRWFLTHDLPDLILADIQLTDGVSFDALGELTQPCPIIFTTAFDEYALQAFRVFSLDYLLKPISTQDLARALDKWEMMVYKYQNADFVTQMRQVLARQIAPSQHKQRFAVHQGLKVVLVPVQEIVAFVRQELIFLIDQQGKRYSTDYRSLDELDELLDPQVFLRANRQTILHLPYIRGFRPDDGGKLEILIRQDLIPPVSVSKEKAGEVRRWLEQ